MSTELKKVIDEIGDAFEKFKGNYEDKFEDLSSDYKSLEFRISQAEAQAKLPRRGDGITGQNYNFREENEQLRELLAGRVKAVDLQTGVAGSNAAPSPVSDALAREMRRQSPLLDHVLIEEHENLQTSKVIIDDDTAAGFVAETGTRSATATPNFRVANLTGNMVFSHPSTTEEAAQDLNWDVAGLLLDEGGRAMAQKVGQSIVSGDGSNGAFTGFLNGATVSPQTIVATADGASPQRAYGSIQYLPTGNASGFQADYSGGLLSPIQNPAGCLYDALYALLPQYRMDAAWVMNSTTLATIAKWRDQNGNPLLDGLMRGADNILLGKPIIIDESMPAIGANTHPVAIADWKRAYCVQFAGPWRTTVDDNITVPGYLKLYLRRRARGGLLDSKAVKLIRCAAS